MDFKAKNRESKACNKCLVVKPLTDFYKSKTKGCHDGRTWYCKECLNILGRQRFATDAYRIRKREQTRSRRSDPMLKPEIKRLDRENARRQRVKHPQKIKARQLLQRAIKNGTIKRPNKCSECGSGGLSKYSIKIQAHHHKGYMNALDVQWLCIQCHADIHRSLKKAP